MTSMARAKSRVVVGGVDTHGQTHHAAVIDGVGRELDDREFRRHRRATVRWRRGLVIMVSLTEWVWRVPAPTGRRWPATCATAA